MRGPLRILIIDDSEQDALLLLRALRKGDLGPDVVRVDTAEGMRQAMAKARWDVAISDCHMPEFTVQEALGIWQASGNDLPFIVVSGAIGEEEAVSLLKAGAHDFVKKDNLARLVPAIERELREVDERRARKEAEKALRLSEEHRYKLQAEVECASRMQKNLLPRVVPDMPGFEVAARCRPAFHVGGDFFDWQTLCPGMVTLTLGDVMGKGLAAAMLMATVRAALRAVAQQNRPARAVELAERALNQDLARSDSFVTLFHALLNVSDRSLTYVDCGHGYVFLRRSDGKVEELLPRGLPLGVASTEIYQEGVLYFEKGDTLVVYSDGVIDAAPELELDNQALSDQMSSDRSAQEMLDGMAAILPTDVYFPDDITFLVIKSLGSP